MPLPEPPKHLVDALLQSRSIAIVGSGVSRAAGAPSWDVLLERIADDAEKVRPHEGNALKEARDLLHARQFLDSASILKKILGPLFADTVKRRIEIFQKPGRSHQILMELPFRAIITTNYDRLLELSCDKPPPTWYWNDEGLPTRVREGKRFILKVHGDVERPEAIVLARDDYDKCLSHNSTQDALRHLLGTNVPFFVGYGHSDMDLDGLLNTLRLCDNLDGGITVLSEPSHATQIRLENAKIFPIELDSHDDVPKFLESLKQAVQQASSIAAHRAPEKSQVPEPSTVEGLSECPRQSIEPAAYSQSIPAAKRDATGGTYGGTSRTYSAALHRLLLRMRSSPVNESQRGGLAWRLTAAILVLAVSGGLVGLSTRIQRGDATTRQTRTQLAIAVPSDSSASMWDATTRLIRTQLAQARTAQFETPSTLRVAARAGYEILRFDRTGQSVKEGYPRKLQAITLGTSTWLFWCADGRCYQTSCDDDECYKSLGPNSINSRLTTKFEHESQVTCCDQRCSRFLVLNEVSPSMQDKNYWTFGDALQGSASNSPKSTSGLHCLKDTKFCVRCARAEGIWRVECVNDASLLAVFEAGDSGERDVFEFHSAMTLTDHKISALAFSQDASVIGTTNGNVLYQATPKGNLELVAQIGPDNVVAVGVANEGNRVTVLAASQLEIAAFRKDQMRGIMQTSWEQLIDRELGDRFRTGNCHGPFAVAIAPSGHRAAVLCAPESYHRDASEYLVLELP